MATENMNQMKFVTQDGNTYDFNVVDKTARELAQKALEAVSSSGGSGSSPVKYVESLDEANLANLRDLSTGTYVLYGYFYPHPGAADTLTCDNTLASVAHLSAGSHVLVFNPLNCKVNFLEILVDETADSGFTYSVQIIDMRDLPALIEAVGSLEELSTTNKTSIVGAINEVAANAGSGDSGQNVVLYDAQELTDEQKAQARENIGAATVDEVISELEAPGAPTSNLLDGAEWANGYLSASNTISPQTNNAEVCMVNPVQVAPNTGYVFTYRFPSTFAAYGWFAILEYDASGTIIKRTAVDFNMDGFSDYVVDGSVCIAEIDFVTSENTSGVAFTMRTFINRNGTTDEEKAEQTAWAAENMSLMQAVSGTGTRLLPEVTESDNEKIVIVKDGAWTAVAPIVPASVNPNVKSVNHRGYNSVAPENTLSAYRLSKKMGFDMVECDVSFTSDGYAVLLHDTTVDRTSDGTGTISELTFEYVRSLDFGSWKSADYAGEQIPTFDEFISLCRKLGLHPYIEIKTPATQTQVEGLVDTVKKYGMLDKVTWITSAGVTYLTYVKNIHENARLGLVCGAVSEGIVNGAVGLRTEKNEVFLDAVSEQLTDDMITLCIENNVPIEVWDLWSAAQITAVNPYISGFTTDTVIAGAALYNAGL